MLVHKSYQNNKYNVMEYKSFLLFDESPHVQCEMRRYECQMQISICLINDFIFYNYHPKLKTIKIYKRQSLKN